MQRCTKDILKANLVASTHYQQMEELTDFEPNGVNAGFLGLKDYTTEIQEKTDSAGLGVGGGGSSLPNNLPSILYSGLLNRAKEKPKTLRITNSPAEMEKLDRTVEQLMKKEGLDKASLDVLCEDVAKSSTTNDKYMRRNLVNKAAEAMQENEPAPAEKEQDKTLDKTKKKTKEKEKRIGGS